MLKNNLIRKFNRRLAIWRLKRRYAYLREVETIMEEWIIKRVLEGQENRREELIEQRKKIKEIELFLNHLRQL